MIRFRPFCNADVPALVHIWRSHPPMRGLMQPMSVGLFEQVVLSKPYFDRQGLILAERDGEAVGFVHAGFGPTHDRADMSHAQGTTCMLMVVPHADEAQTRRGLLECSEKYLQERGAQQLFGGAVWPLTPFYVGLYGGSGLGGVLDSDYALDQLFETAGYTRIDRSVVWQRELAGFHAPVDRQQVRLRRDFELVVRTDEPTGSWWQACTIDQSFHVQFQLVPRRQTTICAVATFWDMEPLASGWGVPAMGIVDLYVDPNWRRQGLATFLLSESFKQLGSEGVTLIEAQASSLNHAAHALLVKLGFRQRERASVFMKQAV